MGLLVLRVLDRWIGIPICFALTVCAKILGVFSFRAAPAKPTKLLNVKLIEQGATVLAYEALTRQVRTLGKENVYFVLFKENRPILDILDVLAPENIIEVRTKSFVVLTLDLLKAIWTIRRARIDSVVDMEMFSRGSSILCFLSGASRRVGFHRFTSEGCYRGDLFTHRMICNAFIHITQTYNALTEVALTGADGDPIQGKFVVPPAGVAMPRYRVNQAARKKMEALLSGTVVKGPRIILNANASDILPLRKWPTDNFRALAQSVLTRWPDATVIFTGTKEEAEPVARLEKQLASSRVLNLAGKTTLTELFELYDLSDVMVTNDSGPAHFASITSTRIIVMFGPETPKLFAPLGPRVEVVWKGLACSPCVSAYNHRISSCTDNLCLKQITPNEVMQCIERAIGATGRRAA